jgi:hypothetical protein
MESTNIYLQLGDIIQIDAPNNDEINNKYYLINYFDQNKMKLVSNESDQEVILNIEDNQLTDESITAIKIINRPDTRGYAKLNNLLPDTWINIFFAGDYPTTIVGQISNLEEDMIEVKTVDGDLIYIDFGYKGIPEDIPIEKIVVRPPPSDIEKEETKEEKEISDDILEAPQESVLPEEEVIEPVLTVSAKEIKNQIKDILLDADQITFGADLGTIAQLEEIPDAEKRYSLEAQTQDLLDELLATVPNKDRTRNVLNTIHQTIERFVQLREKFSDFDKNGNANKPALKGANYKPIIDYINNLNFKIYWLLPIVKNKKKVYDTELPGDITDYPSLVDFTLAESLIQQFNVREDYVSNTTSYSTYMNQLQPYFTPFDSTYDDNILLSTSVNQNLTGLIDTLGDLFSYISKNDSIKRRKFIIQRYNLGLKKLNATTLTSSKMITERVPLTSNDEMQISSLLILPEPIVTFSQIHLPKTTILDQTNLNRNFFNYWQFFRKNLNINTQIINDLDSPIAYDEANFLKMTNQYLLDESIDTDDKFKKYLNSIIPKTRILFNLIKKYINGKLSLYEVVKYLEPFYINMDDISFKQYEEIVTFIQEKVLLYKKKYAENKELFNGLDKFKTRIDHINSNLYQSLLGEKDLGDLILEKYGMRSKNYKAIDDNSPTLSDSEIIKIMMNLDYFQFYNTSVAILNRSLQTPFNFDDLLDEKKADFDKQLAKEDKENDCAQFTLAKEYIDIEDLKGDDNIDIFYDKKFDTTFYSYINEFKNEKASMNEKEFKKFIKDKLVSDVGVAKSQAYEEASTMIMGKKPVKEDDYAVLILEDGDEIKYYYYKRTDNKWARDETIPENTFYDTSNLFCNTQDKCISINQFFKDKKGNELTNNVTTCATTELGEDLIKQNIIKEMYDEFDSSYDKTKKQLSKELNQLFKYQASVIYPLKLLKRYLDNKNDYDKFALGMGEEERDVITSPKAKLLNLILGQSDFVKKQNDIVLFKSKFLRDYNQLNDEDPWWYYCIETDIKLLPTFVFELAAAFVERGDYFSIMEIICNQRGKKSDDGDKWVDEYSGWTIRQIAAESDEGYDEGGRKVQSREILEMDAGDSLLQIADKSAIKYSNPLAKLSSNILTTLSGLLGINIDTIKDDIINHTLTSHESIMDTKENHERKSKARVDSGKKPLPPYETVYYQSLLFILLAYMITYISANIPSFTSKKTYPKCKKSLIGYPVKGDEDLSNINYIACIIVQLKQKSVIPWNTIYGMKEPTINTNIKKFIDAVVLKNGDITQLIDQKRNYLMQNEDDFIPIELDIKKWLNFLPPLQAITNKAPQPLSKPYLDSLKENIRKNSKQQIEQINAVRSKIIYYSLAIIQSIQKIVEKETPILTNNNLVPFLQNACCNSRDIYETVLYFIKKDPNIKNYNDIVVYLSDVNFDIVNMTEPTILLDNKDTKLKFPVLSQEFSENTIYRAFIEYCNFGNEIPIPNSLLKICLDKPSLYNKDDEIEAKIESLKSEGKNYTLESFNQLMEIVNKNNIIPLNLDAGEISNIQKVRDILNHLIETGNTVFESEFLINMGNVLDTYDLVIEKGDSNIRTLRNYLGTNIEKIKVEIIDFLNKHSSSTSNTLSFIDTIMEFKQNGNEYIINIEDETLYKVINYIKNSIFNIGFVFPSIILNSVDYSSIKIPKHWNLSDKHNLLIKSVIEKHYELLKAFFSDVSLRPFLKTYIQKMKDIYTLVENIHFYSTIVQMDGESLNTIFDNKTSSLLFYFFFLTFIKELTVLSEDITLYESIQTPIPQLEEITTDLLLEQENTGQITELEIIRGEQLTIREKLAKMIINYCTILSGDKKVIDVNSDIIKEKITRLKDKEKDKITTKLRDLSPEEREVENLFKDHRLERWDKGQQKGLTEYVQKTFDEEIAEMEADELRERQLQERVDRETFNMNRDILMDDHIEQQRISHEIEREEYDMGHFADDDDMMDNDDGNAIDYNDELDFE